MHEPYITYRTELSANIVQLCRFLRKKGFLLSATEEADALSAITELPIHKESYFKQALKTILSKNRYQFEKFDDYYTEFWKQLEKARDSKTKDEHVPKKKESQTLKRQASFESLKDWLNLNPSEEQKEIASFSNLDVLTKKDFSDLSEEEMRLMMRTLKRMARKMARQKSRLRKTSKRHRELDLKRSIRKNMRRGGDIQHLIFSEKKNKKLKMVLLCDVSKSMELYSRFFVHLIYAFQNAYDKIETFVFSTALHRVSDILDQHEFGKAFDTISDRVPHWSGGTTIGNCLQDFDREFGHGLLDKKTVVLILSDGWDTGAPETISEAMKSIYKKSRRVIWLNPLAGNPNFSPEAMGMKSALPYIDVLASAHNLDSLQTALQAAQKSQKIRVS